MVVADYIPKGPVKSLYNTVQFRRPWGQRKKPDSQLLARFFEISIKLAPAIYLHSPDLEWAGPNVIL